MREDRRHAAHEAPAQDGGLPKRRTPVRESDSARVGRGPLAVGGRRARGLGERWPARRGAQQGEREEQHECDGRESALGRQLEVVVMGMIPDAALDGRRLVRTEGMQPRAETGAEQRMVADDRPACGAHGETAREAHVDGLGGAPLLGLVGGAPEGDREACRQHDGEHDGRG